MRNVLRFSRWANKTGNDGKSIKNANGDLSYIRYSPPPMPTTPRIFSRFRSKALRRKSVDLKCATALDIGSELPYSNKPQFYWTSIDDNMQICISEEAEDMEDYGVYSLPKPQPFERKPLNPNLWSCNDPTEEPYFDVPDTNNRSVIYIDDNNYTSDTWNSKRNSMTLPKHMKLSPTGTHSSGISSNSRYSSSSEDENSRNLAHQRLSKPKMPSKRKTKKAAREKLSSEISGMQFPTSKIIHPSVKKSALTCKSSLSSQDGSLNCVAVTRFKRQDAVKSKPSIDSSNFLKPQPTPRLTVKKDIPKNDAHNKVEEPEITRETSAKMSTLKREPFHRPVTETTLPYKFEKKSSGDYGHINATQSTLLREKAKTKLETQIRLHREEEMQRLKECAPALPPKPKTLKLPVTDNLHKFNCIPPPRPPRSDFSDKGKLKSSSDLDEKLSKMETPRSFNLPQSSNPKNWDKGGVEKWLLVNNLGHMSHKFKDFDGPLLIELVKIYSQSCKTFYETVNNDLGLELVDLLKLGLCLDKLHSRIKSNKSHVHAV